MTELLDWKESLELLTDNDLYTQDSYLTGDLHVNEYDTKALFQSPNMYMHLDNKFIHPDYYKNEININEVCTRFLDSTVIDAKFQFTFDVPYKLFGVYFTNTYFNNSGYVSGNQNNIQIKLSIDFTYNGQTYAYTNSDAYIWLEPSFLNVYNGYVDFNSLNENCTHAYHAWEGQGTYGPKIIPEGAVINSCSIKSMSFRCVKALNNTWRGYINFYSPTVNQIVLSTNKLYDYIYNTSTPTTRFKDSTNELTRRLISNGILSEALFAEQDKCKNRWSQIFNKIASTQDEFDKLISTQEDIIEKITADIETVNKSYFKDTPQIDSVTEDDRYNSNITINKTSTNVGNAADKLVIAKAALEDIYNSWLKEFIMFFIY